jgi:hypothetical protein
MVTKGIKRLIYNNLNEILTIIFDNGERKDVKLKKEDYETLLKTGKFEQLL